MELQRFTGYYSGEITCIDATNPSIRLVSSVCAKYLDCYTAIKAQLRDAERSAELAAKTASALIATDKSIISTVTDHVTLIFGPFAYFLDPPILRIVQGHPCLASSPTAELHRDTWFGHSQAQINFWIPVEDVSDKNTLGIASDYFSVPVSNSSNEFSFEEASSLVLKRQMDLIRWPEIIEEIPRSSLKPFVTGSAGSIVFSGAHLHGPYVSDTNLARMSIDFRVVPKDAHFSGLGAPNVDNYSKDLNIQHLLYVDP